MCVGGAHKAISFAQLPSRPRAAPRPSCSRSAGGSAASQPSARSQAGRFAAAEDTLQPSLGESRVRAPLACREPIARRPGSCRSSARKSRSRPSTHYPAPLSNCQPPSNMAATREWHPARGPVRPRSHLRTSREGPRSCRRQNPQRPARSARYCRHASRPLGMPSADRSPAAQGSGKRMPQSIEPPPLRRCSARRCGVDANKLPSHRFHCLQLRLCL